VFNSRYFLFYISLGVGILLQKSSETFSRLRQLTLLQQGHVKWKTLPKATQFSLMQSVGIISNSASQFLHTTFSDNVRFLVPCLMIFKIFPPYSTSFLRFYVSLNLLLCGNITFIRYLVIEQTRNIVFTQPVRAITARTFPNNSATQVAIIPLIAIRRLNLEFCSAYTARYFKSEFLCSFFDDLHSCSPFNVLYGYNHNFVLWQISYISYHTLHNVATIFFNCVCFYLSLISDNIFCFDINYNIKYIIKLILEIL